MCHTAFCQSDAIPFAMSINAENRYGRQHDHWYNYTVPIGFIAGGNIGVRLGPGTLFLDIRFAGDFGDTNVYGYWGNRALYNTRMLVSCSLGYEFCFGGIKRR